MWIFMSDAFLSIVADKKEDSHLLVRARHENDITAVFPKAVVTSDEGTDYKFRASISRPEVETVRLEHIQGIDYSNFKATISDEVRHKSYMNVWRNMRNFERHYYPQPESQKRKGWDRTRPRA